MAQTQQISRNNTKVHTHGGSTYVTLHGTDVVVFDQDWVKLNTGGYFSHTTKDRMNQASNQFDLGYRVYQKAYRWYVETPKGETLEFTQDWVAFSRA